MFCNCIARNLEGVELHGATSSTVQQNLVKANVSNGIRLRKGTKVCSKNTVASNVSTMNGADGIILIDKSTLNLVTENECFANQYDGIELNNVLKNSITLNSVTNNLDAGIPVVLSTKNLIDGNSISGNGDGLTDQIMCISGSGNTGSNVTPACQ